MKPASKLFQENIVQLLQASEQRIAHCVSQLDQDQLWFEPGPGQNSVGSLIRHIEGNLRQWAISGIRRSTDHRDRESEFDSQQRPSHLQLLTMLKATIAEAIDVIQLQTDDSLSQPREIQQFNTTVMGAILHTVPHCVGHTHQIVQLTRMQLGQEYCFHWSPSDPRTSIPL